MKTSLLFKKLRPCAALLLLVTVLTASSGHAQTSFNPPQLMSYQGYLTDQSGNPLGATNTGPKNYNVIFRIWNTQTGGTAGSASELYAEQQTVTVTSGYFSVLLGLGSAVGSEPHPSQLSSIFSPTLTTPLYVEITVLGIGPSSGNVTILPRLQLVSSPYSFLAANAVNAANLVNSSNASIISVNNNNVGINTSPDANYALAVNGNILANSATISGALSSGALTASSANVSGALNAGSGTVSGLLKAGSATVTGALSSGALTASSATVSGTPSSGALTASSATVNGAATVSGTLSSGALTASSATVNGALKAGSSGSVVILSNGNVGIGTATPGYPLDVESAASYNLTSRYGYLNTGGSGSTSGAGTVNVGIYAAQRILSVEFDALSDARLKQIVDRSDSAQDLAQVRQLKITDYHKIDRIANGDTLFKGVIAQEVEKIMPEAVTQSSDYIPDIYSLATDNTYDALHHTLRLTLAKEHGLQASNMVKIITSEGELKLPVLAVLATNIFEVELAKNVTGKVFVYGKQVSDLRAVNYDRLFTTGLGAIQELAKRMDDLSAREMRLSELEKKAAQVDTLQQEVTDLKKVVAQLAESNQTSGLATGATPSPKLLTTASLDR